MNRKFLNIYNNLIKLTRNKSLYDSNLTNESFSDRLIIFLFHFAFFLKVYKNEKNSAILQEIYDANFRQLELTIREIGYGDQSINKKMKDYINLFHSLVSEIHFWDDFDNNEKEKKFSIFLENFEKTDYLIEYFEKYKENLSKKTLNSYLKSVSNL